MEDAGVDSSDNTGQATAHSDVTSRILPEDMFMIDGRAKMGIIFETQWKNEYNRVLQCQYSLQDFWNTTYKNKSFIQKEITTITKPETAADNSFDQ